LTAEFHYPIRWRSFRVHPGHHRSSQTGGSDEFYGHAPLMAYPEPRHIDVHATLHDPFGQFMVRVFRQRSSVPVQVVADVSASMGFGAGSGKLARIADFCAAAAYSAFRTGDPFGFLACDTELRWDLHLPLRWYKGLPEEFRTTLSAFDPAGRSSAEGLCAAAAQLGRQRSLVFLISDFHLSPDDTTRVLDAFVHHDVVPIVVWSDTEYEQLPAFGWLNLADPETGRQRRLFMRPRLREQFVENFRARRAELSGLCGRHGRRPFFLGEPFDADAMTRYFLTE
jgi:uncharacterized protein (DUF58 family)